MLAPREDSVEDYLVERIERMGGLCEKFTTPGRRGPPDRLVTLPWGTMRLVEVKRPKGGMLSEGQKRDHARRAKCGVIVQLLWTQEMVGSWITFEVEILNARNRELRDYSK